MQTSQSAYRCICSDMVLCQTQIYCYPLVIYYCYYYYCYCHHHFSLPPPPPPFFLDIPTLCSLSVTKSTSIFVFPKLFLLQFFPCPSFLPSFCITLFLTSCFYLILFFLIDTFILVLCSKPLELYLHSFLKHSDIVCSYSLSQKKNITCVI